MPAMTEKGTARGEVTVKEAAVLLRVDESTIRRWLANDRVPYIQHEPGGVILIRVVDLMVAKTRSQRSP